MNADRDHGLAHWHASSCAGFLLTGTYRPVCSLVEVAPDCRCKAAFQAATNWHYRETRHTGRIHDTWLIGCLLRGPLV